MNVARDDETGAGEWRPTDRRQIETYRLLRLFGDAPAAHFHDACRMMAGIDLQATTHLVAHSLRECEAAVRGVLFSMLGAEPRAAVDSARMKHHEQIEQICTLLGFDDDDQIRGHWWGWAERLHELTHRHSLRAPRPVDDGFRAWWTQAQTVLALVARRFETVYGEALPRLEQLATNEVPGQDDLSELRERVPHGDVALGRFFELATPAWFALLREGGYFNSPPPIQPDEEGRVAYVPWPPGDYLARLARDEPLRAEVLELARALGGTENPAAQEAIVDVALAIAADDSVVLVEQIAGFLSSPYQWRLPFKARQLIAHLVDGGEIAGALALFRALVSPSTPSGDSWRAHSLLEELIPALFPVAGSRGLDVLIDVLDGDLAQGARTRDQDHSYIWRPTLESGRRQDFRDTAVTALRDAATRVLQDDPTRLPDVIGLLEGRSRSIFRRLALDLLRQFPNSELVAARLGDRACFDYFNLEREWTLLAAEQFATLPGELHQRILGWIAAGPADARDADGDDATMVERRERWQLRQLFRLGGGLPDDWHERRDKLLARYGEPDLSPLTTAVWRGGAAPLSKEELAAMRVDDIVNYLNTWAPEDSLEGPSPDALATLLSEVVADDSARFAAAAERFADVDPTYARNLVAGLTKAASAGQVFDWRPVLSFADTAVDRPRLMAGRPQHGNSLDPGWSWTRIEIARLLSTGLEKQRIPVEVADDVWALLAALAEDEEPDLAYEEEWSGDGALGPVGVALNTVRGAAMQAVMHYAWWRMRQTPEDEMPAYEPRLRELLDRRLDPAIEPTRAVRAVYGQWFPYLVTADENWSTDRVDAIFPLHGEQAHLGRVAWETYLLSNRVFDSAFERLRSQYAAAIARAAASEDTTDELRLALVGHLISLYVRGSVELDDDLLGRFFAEAPVELRASLITTIGTDVTSAEELPEDRLERLRTLLESRLGVAIASGGAALRELGGFAWWFRSGKFPDDWSLNQLTAILHAGGTVEPEHVVAERLNELRETHLAAVVPVLSGLIETSQDPWFILGSRDEIRAILRAALESQDEGLRVSGRQTTSRLLARGHLEFRDLLT
jgi:hypothetical protein